jgi:hypothetical protein
MEKFDMLVSNTRCKPKCRHGKVGHHAVVPPPTRFYIQLDKDELYMLVILTKFRSYLNWRPYPQLVSIKNGKDCKWVVHANRFKDTIILDKGWHAFAAFYNLKVGDYSMCKVTIDGFKMKVYDPISYD